jgi:hypothetical protein
MTNTVEAPEIDPDLALFPLPPTVLTIGTEQCPILPLNLHGLKAVLRAIKDSVQPLTTGWMEFIKENKAYAADSSLPAPNVMWWFPLIEDNLDKVLLAVLQILQRGNAKLSFSYLEDNLNVFVDLPLIWQASVRSNHLAEMAKKIVASELANQVQIFLRQQVSSSQTSSSTSPTTTGSPSTT